MARYVVGGAPERIREQSLSSEALAEIIQGQTGRGIEIVPASQIPGGASGAYIANKYTGRPERILVKKGLSDANFDTTARHEVGHLLDEVSGQIPTGGLSNELRPLYNYGVEGRDRTRNFTGPKNLKYTDEEVPREYMAEAIRQYMVAPDDMKVRAPKTAARIRKYINEHPELGKIIQFNMLGGAAYLGGQYGPPSQEDQRTLREYLGR